MKKYWDNAITLDEYLAVAKQRLQEPANDQEKEFAVYYELGLQRMDRFLKTYKTLAEQTATLSEKNFAGKLLIISEPWCGDASATVPAVYQFFESNGVEVKIFLRDQDYSLIDQFLTNGTQSIPIVLILDADFQVITQWGPRPEFGLQLLKKYKDNPEVYPKDVFYNDLQVYYAKNRGKDVINEILDLL